MKYPLVAVTWDDAHGAGAVAEDPTAISHRPMRITTYGAAIKADEVGITLAGEVCEDGLIRNRTFIPRAMLVSVVKLRETKERKKKAPQEEGPPVEPLTTV